MSCTVLKIAGPNDVLLNISWIEREDAGTKSYTNPKLQPLFDMLKRSNYNYQHTYLAVKDWMSFNLNALPNEAEGDVEQPKDDSWYWLWYNLDACMIYDGKEIVDHTIQGRLQIGISMEPTETEIDMSFFSPLFSKSHVNSYKRVTELDQSKIMIQLGKNNFNFVFSV